MLTELLEYAAQDPTPSDARSVQQTHAYLQACNALFERGILGKKVYIRSMASPVIESIDKGFQFFATWADSLLHQGLNVYL